MPERARHAAGAFFMRATAYTPESLTRESQNAAINPPEFNNIT